MVRRFRVLRGFVPSWLYDERGDDRRVVARPDILLHRTRRRARRERLAGEDVVSRQPMLRCRMFRQGAHQVNRPSLSGSSARPTSTRPRPNMRSMRAAPPAAGRSRAAFALSGARPFRPRDVHVSAAARAGAPVAENDAAYASIASRNVILAGKSLPPFGTYTDAIGQVADVDGERCGSRSRRRGGRTRALGANALLT